MNIALLADADRTLGANDPSLAVGLNDVAFYSTELPFLNVLKQAGDRHTNDGAWTLTIDNGDGTTSQLDFSEAWHAGYLDELGNVKDLPDGATASTFLFNSIAPEAGTGGRYVLTYEGEGDIQIGGANIVESEPGRIVLELADGDPLRITLADVDSTNWPTDLALVREEHVELYEAGAIFNPDFISLFEDHRTLRFMDWMETNHSNQIDFGDLASFESAFWSIPANQSYEYVFANEIEEFSAADLAELSRGGFTPIYIDPQTNEPFRDPVTNEILTQPPTDVLPDGIPTGVPIEVMVALANQVGADPWFNIPHQATDEYVREFTEYVRDNLDPGLVAHFEFSNETWNGQFEQFSYLNDKALDFFGDEFGDFPVNIYYGYRSAEIQTIIDDVYGEEAAARTHGVLATQTANIGVLNQAILGVNRFIEDTGSNQVVSDLFDSASVTGYFGPTIGEGSAEFPGVAAVYRALVDESNARFANGETSNKYEYFIEQFLIDLRDSSVTNAFYQEAFDNGEISAIPLVFSIAEVRGYFEENFAVAQANGLELTQYEGGSHVVTIASLFGDTELLEFIDALNTSPEIGQIYTDLLTAFRQVGGTLANDFIGVAQHSQFGAFGTLEHLNDTSSAYDAFNAYNDYASAAFGTLNSGRDLSAFQHGVTDQGTTNNDTLIGSSRDDFLTGDAGDDILVGGQLDDGLNGGAGRDIAVFSGVRAEYSIAVEGQGYRLTGPDGSDFLINVEVVAFEDGESILIEDFAAGASPFVTYQGGEIYTAVSGQNNLGVTIAVIDPSTVTGSQIGVGNNAGQQATQAVYYIADGILDQQTRNIILSGVDNAEGRAEIIGNVSAFEGTFFGDSFEGHETGEIVNLSSGDDILNGNGGDDTLSGGSGNDSITGGFGADNISGGVGDDTIDGGQGFDTLVLSGSRENYSISLEGNGYRLVGAEGSDFLINVEVASFSDGQSIIIEDWVAGVPNGVRVFGGGEFTAQTNSFAGVIIAPVSSETVTGDELGVVTGASLENTQIYYYVNDRDNAQATFEAIHDFGVSSAITVTDIISNVSVLNGTDFNDVFDGSSAGESVYLGAGDDRLNGFGGADTLDGGAGNDFIGGGNDGDTLIGGLGNDTINGGGGDDLLVLSGNEEEYEISVSGNGYVITGIEGTDLLFNVERVEFGDGQISLIDVWVGNAVIGATDLMGGAFTAAPNNSAGVSIAPIDIGTQTADDLGIPLTGFTTFADTVFFVAGINDANATYENIHAGATSAASVGQLITNLGRLIGTDFDDSITGGIGNDIFEDNFGNDTLAGGGGIDQLSGGIGFDSLFGGDGDDLLDGGNNADNLFGGSGDDIIEGGQGLDRLFGEFGNDDLNGGLNNDAIFGGVGFDSLFGDDGNDFLDGGNNADILFGHTGNDTLYGGQGLDHLFAGIGNDLLSGGLDADALFGDTGNDALNGDDGNDRLSGGAGFDTLNGGIGNDSLYGNFNWDIFRFDNGFGQDTIFDFDVANQFERIDLSGVSNITSFQDLVDQHLGQDGNGNAVITDGANSITLIGVDVNNLSAGDFIF